MFAGGAVAWLGVLLVISERELKGRRREVETLLTKLESTHASTSTESVQSDAAQAEVAGLRDQNRNLQSEVGALTSELDQTRAAIAELRSSRQSGTSSQLEQQLKAENECLNRDLNEIRARLASSEAQIQGSIAQGRDAQDDRARMQAEVDNLRSALSDSRAEVQKLENARQNLPDVNAIAATYNQERSALEQRIAELERRLSTDREKLAELQTVRDHLAQAQAVEASLRDEIRRHESEIPRWLARVAAAEENRRRLAALQGPCDGLLSKQAALADRQRQLQVELVTFARQVAAAVEGNEASNTPSDNSEGKPAANIAPEKTAAKPAFPAV
jgi:chromosome segregation ATPase